MTTPGTRLQGKVAIVVGAGSIGTDISKSDVIVNGWGGTHDIVDGAIVGTLTASF